MKPLGGAWLKQNQKSKPEALVGAQGSPSPDCVSATVHFHQQNQDNLHPLPVSPGCLETRENPAGSRAGRLGDGLFQKKGKL